MAPAVHVHADSWTVEACALEAEAEMCDSGDAQCAAVHRRASARSEPLLDWKADLGKEPQDQAQSCHRQ
jgi:hypothetical protein